MSGPIYKDGFVYGVMRKESALASAFPELLAVASDDETGVIYWPKTRQFGIPVLDGGSSIVTITHDPFTGKRLPKPLDEEWFAAVTEKLGRPYTPEDAASLPEELKSEDWWVAAGL